MALNIVLCKLLLLDALAQSKLNEGKLSKVNVHHFQNFHI